MRLFTAIDLSDEVRANIEDLQHKLKPAARIQWSPASNLHITTKFIGEWKEARLDELKAALTRIPPAGSIDIEVSQLGWFPNLHSPRVFCVGVRAPPALRDLANSIDDAVAELGVPAERKVFSPHMTLARIRTPQPLGPLRYAVADLESQEFGSFAAARYHLYLSEQSTGGSRYSKLADFSLIP